MAYGNAGRKRPDLSARNRKHGRARDEFYPVWRDMVGRCHNHPHPDYGGRGIYVCDEWRHDPHRFIAWCEVQPKPAKSSLDRIDNDGPYAPWNCRFATPAQQNRNMRSNVWIEHNGERLIFKDFVEKYGVVSYERARKRVLVLGWERKDAALLEPWTKPRQLKPNCKHGHALEGANLHIDPKTGARCCRQCRRDTLRRLRERKAR
jgi:hypothetical protein